MRISSDDGILTNRLVVGQGRFVHNLGDAQTRHIAFVRSDHAHGNIIQIDTKLAKDHWPSVSILLADDFANYTQLKLPSVNPLLDIEAYTNADVIAKDVVTSVGQVIAVVIAASAFEAKQAAQLITVEYQAAKEIFTSTADHAKHSPVVASAIFGACLNPDPDWLKVSITSDQPRVSAAPLEPRAIHVQWWAAEQKLIIHIGTQTPARTRVAFAAALGLPTDQIEIIAPDVGGAFGAKSSVHPDELLVACVAHKLSTTVKWCATRSEEFSSTVQGRGAQLAGSLWINADGIFQHLEAKMQFALGAWLPYSAVVPARNAARILPGPYQLASVDIAATCTMSHQAAINIYRGAGRPEAALLMERLIDRCAKAVGKDPLQLRQKNLIPSASMPFTTATGETLDSGDYLRLLDRCAQIFDYAGKRKSQEQRRQQGDLYGIGIAMYVEPSGTGWESARITYQSNHNVVIASGSANQGQQHAVSFAKIAQEVLGVSLDVITVIEGDTRTCPAGVGALASRSTAIGGSAVLQAAQKLKGLLLAGNALPITVDVQYTAPAEAWGAGCVMISMAIDADTGVAKIEQAVWVDDAGRVISPDLVKSQFLGGLAQGFGQAMMEAIRYDAQGQLLTGSFMDYAMPRASDVPSVTIESLPSKTQANLLGAKGVGEAGCIGVAAALLNAACDALVDFDTDQLNFPLTANRLWDVLQSN